MSVHLLYRGVQLRYAYIMKSFPSSRIFRVVLMYSFLIFKNFS